MRPDRAEALMAFVCECGQEARPGDVECALCGRELGASLPITPAAVSGSDAPGSSRPRARTGARSVLLLVGAAVLVVVLGLLTYVLLGSGSSAPATGAAASEQAQDIPTTAADSEAPPSTEPAEEPSPAEDEPSEDYALVDPPLLPEEQTASIEVVNDSGGQACKTDTSRSLYGGYPLARCELWKATAGLRTGESAGTGTLDVACQRDLREANPTYTKHQSNTWWVWSQSTSGTWDWFPETAVKQGASDQPITGIALCLP